MNLMKVPYKPKCAYVISNELGRLFQGIGVINKTNTLFKFFGIKSPKIGRSPTFIAFNLIPQKKEMKIVQITVGCDRISYNKDHYPSQYKT